MWLCHAGGSLLDLRRRCSRGMKKISCAADIGSRPRSYIGETAAMQNVSRRPQDMSRPSTDDAVRRTPGLLVELRGFKPQCSWRWLPCNRRHSRTARMDFRALPPQRRQGIGRNHAGPDTRFGKRRSDRFAIFCQPLQLLGETYRSFHLGFAFRLRQPKDWRRRRCRW